jgi:hypothetical protein
LPTPSRDSRTIQHRNVLYFTNWSVFYICPDYLLHVLTSTGVSTARITSLRIFQSTRSPISYMLLQMWMAMGSCRYFEVA